MDKAELRSRLKPWLLAVAAALPFQLLLLIDAINFGENATGFTMAELPYYAANGRAYFDHGNGFTHPNPYDLNSPNIYFQLSTWFIGAFNKVTGIDPGVGMAVLGFIFSVLMARVTYSLIARRWQSNRYLTLTYFAVMYSGGIFVLRRVIELCWYATSGGPEFSEILTIYEPSYGWWTLSWGRNMVLTTEAMYHWLMAITWLAILRGQRRLGACLTVLIMITHPWTGVVALGILCAWMVVDWVRFRERPDIIAVLLTLLGALAFAWYYAVFLPHHASHRWVIETWRGLYEVKWQSLAMSLVLPLSLLVLYLKVRGKRQLDREEAFLLVAFGVTFLLSVHDLFMPSIQPLHFNRGYPWLALTLLAIPSLPLVLQWLRKRGLVLSFALAVIALSDNIGFFVTELLLRSKEPSEALSMEVSKDIRELFDYADSKQLRGVCLTDDLLASYATATYSPLRPYVGHRYLTPDYYSRVDRWNEFLAGKSIALLDSVDYLLLHDTTKVNTASLERSTRSGSHSLWTNMKRLGSHLPL